jgi:hypothetical protein
MDSKLELLKAFYAGLPKDRAKVETLDHGFEFLEKMLTDGMTLEYGERVLLRKVYKYKFSNVPPLRMEGFLSSHVQKACNLCLYFGTMTNSLFAFNLDNTHKVDNSVISPEMALAVSALRNILMDAGCTPLVVASGKGCHLWCRLAAAVSNDQLYNFMLRAMAKTLYALHKKGMDYNRINPRFYPDPKVQDKISLRLFGSVHPNTGVFSRVLTQDGLLDEEASWSAFEDHLRLHTISEETFSNACEAMAPASGYGIL